MKSNSLFILLVYLLAFSHCIKAQQTFVRALGEAADEAVNAAIPVPGNEYILAGESRTGGIGTADAILLRVDGLGETIWSKSISEEGEEVFRDLLQTANGLYAIGWKGESSSQSMDVLLTKFNENGEIEWTKIYGGNHEDRGHSIMETSDGNLLIGGLTQSYGADRLDVLVMKIDPDGNNLWTKTYGRFRNQWFNGDGIIENAEGNYVLATTWSGGVGSADHSGMLLTISPDGDEINSRGYGGFENDGLVGYLHERDSVYFNVGASWSWHGDEHSLWMNEFDLSGALNWSKSLIVPGRNIRINSGRFLEDGSYLLSAYDFTENADQKGLLFNVSLTGELNWSKSYGNEGIYRIEQVLETASDIVAFGYLQTSATNGRDILMIRATKTGEVGDCTESPEVEIVTANVSSFIPLGTTMNVAIGNTFLDLETDVVFPSPTTICPVDVTNVVDQATDCNIYVPTAFSPNGDNLNDTFQAYIPNDQCGTISEFELTLFDRAGNLVFWTDRPQVGWDGLSKGELQKSGAYVWRLVYRESGVKYVDWGSLVLVG